MTKDEMTEAIKEALHSEGFDPEEHRAHHEFIHMLIDKEERKKALWAKAKSSFVGTVATALVGGLIWVGNIIIEYFKNGGHQ